MIIVVAHLTVFSSGTHIFQPADVGLNQIIKHWLKQLSNCGITVEVACTTLDHFMMQKSHGELKYLIQMENMDWPGFESGTSLMYTGCSNQLSYWSVVLRMWVHLIPELSILTNFTQGLSDKTHTWYHGSAYGAIPNSPPETTWPVSLQKFPLTIYAFHLIAATSFVGQGHSD